MILDVNSVMELQFLLFSCKRNRLLDFLTSIFSLFADCAAPSNKSSTSDDQGNSNQINPDELKKRTEFLKAQRDKLLAMKRAEREKQLEVRSHHIFFTNSEFSICNFVIKNNGYIGILYSYIQGMSCEGACACEIHSEKCARCACVRLVFGRAMCDPTFAHFL